MYITPPRDVSDYSPRAHGARCDLCPLAGSTYVPYSPPAEGKKLKLIIVGEGPGRKELMERSPFVGMTGQILNDELETAGLDRESAHVTNAAMCLGETDKENERAGECCAPRLLKELAALPPVPIIPLGKAATRAILGVKSILIARGFVWTARDLETSIKSAEGNLRKAEKTAGKAGIGVKADAAAGKAVEVALRLETLQLRHKLAGRTVLPTLHPTFAFVHNETWAPIFRIDLDRAARFIRGELTHDMLADKIELVKTVTELRRKKRTFIVTDNVKQIEQVAKLLGPEVGCDIETERLKPLSPLLAKILCVQISDGDRSIVIAPWDARIHSKPLTELLRGRTVVFHNGYNFDHPALEREGEDVDLSHATLEDTLVAHHAFASQYPQKLDHVVATFIDSSPWKIRFGVRGAEEKGLAPVHSDENELFEYGACLMGDTRVLLADGTTCDVQHIVSKRLSVDVMSCGPEGITAKRVIGWHRSRVPDQRWIKINIEGSEGRRGLIVTPDHRIYTTRGQVRADRIRCGDRIAQNERMLSDYERSAMLGTLLGDSSMAVSPTLRKKKLKAPLASVVGSHEDTCGLAQFKAKQTRGFIQVAENQAIPGGGHIGSQPGRRYSTHMSAQIAALRPAIYDAKGRKRLRVETLDMLGPVGLAWLFMDDGFRQNGGRAYKNTGTRGGQMYRPDSCGISTISFPRKDVLAACEWFKKNYGPTWTGADNQLRLGFVAAKRFCTEIAPFVPEAFRYKFPRGETWPAYIDEPLSSGLEPYYARVVVAEEYHPKRLTRFQRHVANTRFCLTVEDTHNFFTPFGLVANCDAVVTILAWRAMQKDLAAERSVYEHDKLLGVQGKGMQVVGFPVDRKRRRLLSVKLKLRGAALKGRMRKLARRPNFAPTKLGEVRHVLFNVLKAPMLNPTSTGLASTSNATLETIRTGGAGTARSGPADTKQTSGPINNKTKETKAGLFAEALLRWRVADKIRGTYINAVSVHKDGRAHYNWRPYGTVSGRYSCRLQSNPRWSTAIEDRAREMYRASMDHSLFYFDLSQAEARFAANLSGDVNFIETCKSDVHTGNAKILFPDPIAQEQLARDPKGKDCPKHGEVPVLGATCNCGKPYRDIAKNAGFAVAYLAEAPTVFAYLRAHGFPVELDDVERMLDDLKASYHRYYEYVAENVAFCERHGYLRTALMGRIRWFGFHPKPNEIANFPIQSGIADVMNTRLLAFQAWLAKELPEVQLVAQVHDAAIFNTPNKYIQWGKDAKGKPKVIGPMAEGVERLWAEPVRLQPSVVCRTEREFYLPAEIKVGKRWSDFG
jgi:uracil-DNA glycosylase family 4